MRITNSMYYKNVFSPNKTRISQQLFDTNKQISSGMKIEYAKEDISVFSDTMRLDNEITTLKQAKSSTDNALKMSTQSDKTLNDFQTTLDRMKVLMVNAANATHNDSSLYAIHKELQGLRDHLKNLANTSINGQFLFSGTALDTKPIDDKGNYLGNDKTLKAFAGSKVQIQYNIPGSELFLGEESQRHRRITTNVKNYNQSELYPDIMKDPAISRDQAQKKFITADDTIRDLMGDTDTDPSNDPVSHFYLQGQKHDGTSIRKQIDMTSTQSVGELLSAIEDAYGKGTVNVTLNEHGQIEVEDKLQGSSKLKLHLVGAVDFNQDGNNSDDADLKFGTAGEKLISDLEKSEVVTKAFMDSGFTSYTSDVISKQDIYDPSKFSINGKMLKKEDFSNASLSTPLEEIFPVDTDRIALSGQDTAGNAVSGTFLISGKTVQDLLTQLDTTYDADNSLQFRLDNGKIVFSSDNTTSQSNIAINMQTQSALAVTDGFAMDAHLAYDGIKFAKNGNELTSNVSQIVTADNSFATKSTKLSEVADLTQLNNGTLDGTTLKLSGVDISGNKYTAEIYLQSSGSQFRIDTNGDGSVDSAAYSIFDAGDPQAPVAADDMTYGQLGDVIDMIVTGNLPATNTASDYNTAVDTASSVATTDLTYDGKLRFTQKGTANTKAEIAIEDITTNGGIKTASALSFNLNDAITVTDPKTDFFKQIDAAIESVNLQRLRPDSSGSDPRNIGIQNAIQVIDDVSSHVEKMHAKIGALSNSLENSSQRSELLSVSTMSLRSTVLDTDIAEASLKLNQLTINYQAILSTIGRVSQLSLVNYLK